MPFQSHGIRNKYVLILRFFMVLDGASSFGLWNKCNNVLRVIYCLSLQCTLGTWGEWDLFSQSVVFIPGRLNSHSIYKSCLYCMSCLTDRQTWLFLLCMCKIHLFCLVRLVWQRADFYLQTFSLWNLQAWIRNLLLWSIFLGKMGNGIREL